MFKVAVVTACSKNMDPFRRPAIQSYKSARIKAVYNRRLDHDMFIMSGKYNLIRFNEEIERYKDIMDDEKAKKFAPIVAKKLANYDVVVYFRGGARKSYLKCIRVACEIADKTLITLGYAHMGGINDLPKVIREASLGNFDRIREIHHVRFYE